MKYFQPVFSIILSIVISVLVLTLPENILAQPAPVFIRQISSDLGVSNAHGRSAKIGDHYFIPFAKGSGHAQGGFGIFDSNWTRLSITHHGDFREAHHYGFLNFGDKLVVAVQAKHGVLFYDLSNPLSPQLIQYLNLPGTTGGDYENAAWWVHVAGSIVYVGGSGNGIYIIEAQNVLSGQAKISEVPAENPIPIQRLGGFRVGPIFQYGKILVATSMDDSGVVVLDAINPLNPTLKGFSRSIPQFYSAFLDLVDFEGSGNFEPVLVGAGVQGQLHSFKGITNGEFIPSGSVNIFGKGGYISKRDSNYYVGASEGYAIVSENTVFTSLSQPFSNPDYYLPKTAITSQHSDWDFSAILNDKLVIGDDDGQGSFIFGVGQDTNAPIIKGIYPNSLTDKIFPDGHISVFMNEKVDPASFDSSKISLLSSSGVHSELILSTSSNIVYIKPKENLPAFETYTVTIDPGAMRDLSGNEIEGQSIVDFRVDLSPGNSLCELNVESNLTVGQVGNISVSSIYPGFEQVEVGYAWKVNNSVLSAYAGQSSFSYLFDDEGRFLIQFQVEAPDGTLIQCSRAVSVNYPNVSSRPKRSRKLISVSESSWGEVIVHLNSDNDSLAVLNASTGEKHLEKAICGKPKSIAKEDNGRLWISCEQTDELLLLNSANFLEVGRIKLPWGSMPNGLIADGNDLFISLFGKRSICKHDLSNLTSFSASQCSLFSEDETVGGAREIAILPHVRNEGLGTQGFLFAPRFISQDTHGEVFVFDANLNLLPTIAIQFDPSTDTEDNGRGLPNYLSYIGISPSARKLMVPSIKSNIARGLFQDGQPLDFQSSVRAILSSVTLSAQSYEQTDDLSARLDFNDRSFPRAVEFNQNGDLYLVSFLGSNKVGIFDGFDDSLVGSLDNVGSAPEDILFADNGMAYVSSFLSREVYAFDMSEFLENGTVKNLWRTRTVALEKLSPAEMLGKKIFYNASDTRMAKDGYVACVNCHFDGGEDGRVWDFTDRGEGLRNTISLNGKSGTGHGKLHWSANFDEVQDFEHDIRNAFGGTGFLPDNIYLQSPPLGPKKSGKSIGLDALSAYLEGLNHTSRSPYRESNGALTPAGLRGEQLFNSLDCASCHAGGNFSVSSVANNIVFDVGTISASSGLAMGQTIEGIDVPTLNGIWSESPFLHNGNIKTIEQLLTEGHGISASQLPGLTVLDISDLASYIKQLEFSGSVNPGSVNPGSGWAQIISHGTSNRPVIRPVTDRIVYSDRDYLITCVPEFLEESLFIVTANGDKHFSGNNYFTLRLAGPSFAYVLFDDRATVLPGWLNSWTRLPVKVGTTDVFRHVFVKRLNEGDHTFGGNAQPPMAGAGSNFNVMLMNLESNYYPDYQGASCL